MKGWPGIINHKRVIFAGSRSMSSRDPRWSVVVVSLRWGSSLFGVGDLNNLRHGSIYLNTAIKAEACKSRGPRYAPSGDALIANRKEGEVRTLKSGAGASGAIGSLSEITSGVALGIELT